MKFRIGARVALLSTICALPASAADEAPAQSQPTATAPGNLIIVDNRPEADKKNKLLSLLPSNCDYSVRRLGDETSDPSKVRLLEAYLERKLGSAAYGKTLYITGWSIYLNDSAITRGFLYAGGGVAGARAGARTRKIGSPCEREESHGGWYEPADVTTPFSPLISELTATYDGRPLVIRTVYSPEHELRGKFKDNAQDLAALIVTVRRTADAIVAAVAP